MEMVRTFRDLNVWRKAHNLALEIYKITIRFPREEKYGLVAQLRRSGASIPTNIGVCFTDFIRDLLLTTYDLQLKTRRLNMQNKIIALIAFMLLFAIEQANAQELWVAKDGSIRNVDTRAMVVTESGLYLATASELYRARDAKDKWESIFAIPSGSNEVTCLAVRGKNIFTGTRRGLFRSEDFGKSWKNVFRTIVPEKSSIISIEMSKYDTGKILLATARGIFSSEDFGMSWQDISGNLKNHSINCIILNKDTFFAGGEAGLYIKRNSSPDWERAYVRSAAEKGCEEEAPDNIEAGTEEYSEGGVNCIALKDSRLYIGAGKKILYSDDEGKAWKDFSVDGLAGTVNYILPSSVNSDLFCATTKGVFEFVEPGNQAGRAEPRTVPPAGGTGAWVGEKARWLELYKGTNKSFCVMRLVSGGEGERDIWALCGNGLYRLEGGRFLQDQYIDVERNLKSFKTLFDGEPAYAQLQKAAMRFGEVNPEKIARWRTEARMRALAPKVSFGMAKHRSNSYEIYTSATKDYVVSGPDDLYNSLDVSVSWDLGDLIYSDDQTNIDVRSKLTTQLRNDILDDLRRAYFERKRLQFELMQFGPQDMKARFDKELRIQELTQAIDDLTGNYLSEHMSSDEKNWKRCDEEKGKDKGK
jgi:photosystem II stability/assembly factor-like uncharacterized protein